MDFFTISQGNGILAINAFLADDLLASGSGSHAPSIGLALLPTENDTAIQNAGLPFSPLQNLILTNTPFPKPQKIAYEIDRSLAPEALPMIIMNENTPLPPPKNLIAMQQMKEITALSNLAAALKIANFQNDNIPLPPPKN